MLGEWHGGASSVMPIWHDVHRSCGTAFLADETPADRRPGQILGEGIQPDVDHPSITLGRALDVAGHMTVGDPFRRAARWVFFCPSRLWSLRSHPG
jgi:hypothetical protein